MARNTNPYLEPSLGVITVQLKPGQTAVLPNLPAGTTYTVREINLPDAWGQDPEATTGTEGAIAPIQTSEAIVANVYKATGELPLVAHKALLGAELQEGQFTFDLKRYVKTSTSYGSYQTIQTKTNGALDTQAEINVEDGESVANPWYGTALVEFDPIAFTQDDIGQTIQFSISENYTDEAGIVRDSHTEYVDVTVKDAGHGLLDFDVKYNSSSDPNYEPLFTNRYEEPNPGSLKLTKATEGEGPADSEFEFAIELLDADGNPLQGSYNAKRYGDALEPAAYVHTANIADGGEKLSEVATGYTDEIATVPGAENLLVRLRYSNPRGYLWVWEGAHEEIYTHNWTGDFNPNMVIKQLTYPSDDSYKEEEFFVNGDSISVEHYCGYSYPPDTTYPGYNEWTNYGFYIELYDATDVDVFTVGSGDTVKLKAGETLQIDGLPDGAAYKIVETPAAGWEQVSASGDEGAIVAGETAEAAFVNSYDAQGVAKIEGKKTLEGSNLATGDYSFEIVEVDASGNEVEGGYNEVVSNNADGTFAFSPIQYQLADMGKTFYYRVNEVAPEQVSAENPTFGGTTYDLSTYTVEVSVGDAGDGMLACDPSYKKNGEAADAIEFVNSYEGKGELPLSGTKVLEGRGFQQGDAWTFTVEAVTEGAPLPVDSDGNEMSSVTIAPESGAEAAIGLGTLKFDLDDLMEEDGSRAAMKDFVYTITESGTVAGVENDGQATRTVTVRVVDAQNGTLRVSMVADESDNLTWTNTYTPPSGTKVTLSFDKHYYGTQESPKFDFALTAVDESLAPLEGEAAYSATAQNSDFADGAAKVTFDLWLEEPGTYRYLVREVDEGASGVVTDKVAYLATVTVPEEGDPTVAYETLLPDGEGYVNAGTADDVAFYNHDAALFRFASVGMAGRTSSAERVSVYPAVKKYLNGTTASLVGNDFAFELLDAEGNLVAVAHNDASGNVAFFDGSDSMGLTFDEAGTWTYTIRERVPEGAAQNAEGKYVADDVVYDGTIITLTVTVSESDGALTASVSYDGYQGASEGAEPAFYNTREGMDLVVYKRSRYGGEGLENCTYALWMVNPAGDVMIQEATSDATGRILFTDVDLVYGQRYYFKEVEAPAGHTVDPYRTAYFALNEARDGTVIAEETASDGWHSKYENIETGPAPASDQAAGGE